MKEHFTLSKRPTAPFSTAFREGVLPLAGILGITAVLVALFALFLHLGQGMDPIYPVHLDEGETVDPNPMRFTYMVLGLVLSLVIGWWTERRSDRTWTAFWWGYAGGTLLWQSVGEASWHFGFPCEDYLVCFTHLESSASLLLVVLTTVLLIYCARRRAFRWGAWVFILSFVGNWFGHFFQIGTYPICSAWMEEGQWYMLTGGIFGTLTCLFALWLNFFAAKDTRARLSACLLLYFGIGMIVTGVAGL